MLITDSSSSSLIICCTKFYCLNPNTNPRKQFMKSPIFAKKKEYSQNSTPPNKTTSNFLFKVLSSRNLITQSATGVLALGFIDAGYSGDWSRIGVISRETEDLLKAAAVLVVPLCIFLIFFIFKSDDYEE